jgi:hypothetical protein
MKNLFQSKTEPKQVDKIQEIEKKSEAAIAVFKNTLESLTELESEVDTEVHNKEGKIAAIKAEIEILNERKAKNSKFVNKLKEFFE